MDEIHKFFAENSTKDFINYFQLPSDKWPHKGLDRLNHYKINLSSKPGDFIIFPPIKFTDSFSKEFYYNLRRIYSASKLKLVPLLFRQRKCSSLLPAFGGSQWWAIKIETAKKCFNWLSLTHPIFTFIPIH